MISDWPMVPLRDLCDNERGITYGIVQPGKPTNDGIPILRADDIDNGRITTSHLMRVSPEVEAPYQRSKLRGGEVLLTLVGAYFGKTAVAREDHVGLNTARAVGVIPVRESADFVSYALRTPRCQSFMQERATTTAQPTLNLRDVGEIPIPWPSRQTRDRLTHILGTLDDKIELNQRMNETLEAIARAIFKSWFVDFDPVRAKAEGRHPYLPKHIADLFPERFQDSELGEIPTGWEVQSLDKVANYLNGLALQKFPPREEESLPAIKIAQLRVGNTIGADRVGTNVPAEYVIEDGDVLFSWSGSLEVEIWCGGRGALNQHLFKVTSKEFPKWFYYVWTLHYLSDFQDTAANKATTMGHIQRHHLSEAKAIVPPPKLLQAMNQHFSPLLDRLIANRLESRTLADLRDTLLPKLISGELRVENADKFVEHEI